MILSGCDRRSFCIKGIICFYFSNKVIVSLSINVISLIIWIHSYNNGNNFHGWRQYLQYLPYKIPRPTSLTPSLRKRPKIWPTFITWLYPCFIVTLCDEALWCPVEKMCIYNRYNYEPFLDWDVKLNKEVGNKHPLYILSVLGEYHVH